MPVLRYRRVPNAPLHKPRRLQPGMTVALVAPAGTFPRAVVPQVQTCLEKLGYRVQVGGHVFKQWRYMAGEDAYRAQDVWRALMDPAIDAVFCLRGGYGCSRLLTRFPFSSWQGPCKIFLGYSDVSFLHAALESITGWITFHGPNALEWADNPEECLETLAFLQGHKPFSWSFEENQVLYPGRVSGHLVGGNLTCLTHLLGTPFAPTFEQALLFLEEKNEAPYRIDRMLVHLAHAGVFEAVRGVICGSFVSCGDPEEIRTLLREHVLSRHIPAIMDMPFGHDRRNHVLPFGAFYVLDTKAQHFQITETPFIEP